MLHEFAIEPSGLHNFRTFVHIAEMFGISFGRAISRFPKKWKAAVMEACRANAQNTEMQLARIESIMHDPMFEKTKLLGFHRSAPVGPDGKPVEDWHDAALLSHKTRPFHCILVKSRRGTTEPVAEVEDVWQNSALLAVPTWKAIPQDARALARLVAPILAKARQVAIIDPYFHPGKPRWREFVEVLLEEAVQVRSKQRSIVLHTKEMTETTASDYLALPAFEDECMNLASRIPSGLALDIVVWHPLDGGEEMHDRMILTETAALMCGRGWAAARPGAKFNLINLNGTDAWRYWTSAFELSSLIFQKVLGPISVKGTRTLPPRADYPPLAGSGTR